MSVVMSNRNHLIDLLRASALMLMVVFHFIFDLDFFGYAQLSIPNGPGWREFRAVIVSLFLVTMGASLVFAYREAIYWRKLAKRSGLLLLGALAITAVSLVMTPQEWIYFGILHFILIASWLCLGLRHRPTLALIIAVFILLLYNLQLLPGNWPFSLFAAWLPATSADFVAPVPWLASVLIGMFLAHQRWFYQPDWLQLQLPGWMQTLSRQSLWIYLLHQPLLFAGFYLLQLFR